MKGRQTVEAARRRLIRFQGQSVYGPRDGKSSPYRVGVSLVNGRGRS